MGLADLEKDLAAPSVDAALTVGGPKGVAGLEADLAAPPPTGIPGPTEMLQGLRGSVGKMMGNAGLKSAPSWYQDLVNPIPATVPDALALVGGGGAGSAAIKMGAKPGMAALSRLTGTLLGGEAGNVAVGEAPGTGAGGRAVGGVIGEGVGAAGGKFVRSRPWAKGAISEGHSKDLLGTLRDIDPDIGRVIESQQVKPTLKGGTTAAKIQQGIKSGDVQNTASASMERDVGAVNMLSGAPRYNQPALQQAYDSMPPLAQQQMVGAVDPRGFTLQQAQAVRSWVSGPAFSQSPQGQGVGKVPQQKLVGDMTTEIEGGLSPVALPLWNQANRRYSGTMGATDALSDRNAFQGLNNRILLNRNQLSDYLAQNREDLTRRLGPQGYDAFVERVLGGAQPGTRDILASGGGSPTDAFMQTFGRGQGGSPQLIGAPLRAVLPNVGSQYTGRQPYSLPNVLQQALDAFMQRGTGQVRGRD